MTVRTYGQFCGIARALDLVGERWALLVVRELILGPRRFTDLQAGLPSIGTNVLASRLRELEDSDVIARRTLPPPAASTVYELTPYGRELEPILLDLGGWGVRSLGMRAPEQTLRSGWIGVAMRAVARPEATVGLRCAFELRLSDSIVHATVTDGAIETGHGPAERADLVLETDNDTLIGILTGLLAPDAAIAAGAARLSGDVNLLPVLLDTFRFQLPEPSPTEA